MAPNALGLKWFLAAGVGLALGGLADAAPVKVQVVQRDGKWMLLRDGQPCAIKGAGGDGSKALLVQCGGNSFRTWGADNLEPILDEAQKLGLSVAVGIWIGHERHGFDYTNLDQVAKQYAKARETIEKHKDHPAVLMWGIGNEMEGVKEGDNAAIWSAINNIASMAKKIDPNHPTMTTIVEVGGRRVQAVHRLCPDIDIVGINSYAGAPSIPERYRKAGGTKPYIVTEYGPPGVWEIGRNAWGAVEEWPSTKKGEFYRKAYEALAADAGLCLGSYAFTWGNKQEATATWFGILLDNQTRLEAADVMTELWSGKPAANRCPQIRSIAIDGAGQVDPGGTIRAKLDAADPEGDELKIKWVLAKESGNYNTGGDTQAAPPTFPDAIVKADLTGAEVKLPGDGGGYRLFVYLRDGKGGAATANLPLKVKGDEKPVAAKGAKLPFIVLGDDAKPTYAPTGWMGEHKSLKANAECEEQPHSGKTCIRFDYENPGGWVGVVWQDPAGDWGELPGGFDLTGAQQLIFWARGAAGGEKVTFGFGTLGKNLKYHDSANGKLEVTLTKEWKQYTIDLAGKDLSRIKTGFMWTLGGQGKPLTFFVDDVRYE